MRGLLNLPNWATKAITVVVFLAVLAFAVYQGIEPSPDVPDDTEQDTGVIGPKTAVAGEMIVLTADSGVRYYAWTVVPETQFRVLEGGKILVLVFSTPGEYSIILASSNGRAVSIYRHDITVTGEAPVPPVPPDDPDVPQPASDWAKWTCKTVQETVPVGGRAKCKELADGLRGLAAKIAAGAVKDGKQAREGLRATTNLVLGKQAMDWVQFSLQFSTHLESLANDGELTDLKQYQRIFEEVANGLEAVKGGARR